MLLRGWKQLLVLLELVQVLVVVVVLRTQQVVEEPLELVGLLGEVVVVVQEELAQGAQGVRVAVEGALQDQTSFVLSKVG